MASWDHEDLKPSWAKNDDTVEPCEASAAQQNDNENWREPAQRLQARGHKTALEIMRVIKDLENIKDQIQHFDCHAELPLERLVDRYGSKVNDLNSTINGLKYLAVDVVFAADSIYP